jgi:hypothetical protein
MRKTIAALASAAAATMLVGGAGFASASAHPAGPAVSGTEHLYLMTTSATSNKAAVIVDGLFTAGGTDLMGNTVDKIVLPGGTFKIHHPGGNSGKPKVNPLTCLFTLKQAGLRFTVSGGTGRYKGITGSGRAVLSIIAVLGRNSHGKGSYTAKPQGWQQTITGTGHVSL